MRNILIVSCVALFAVMTAVPASAYPDGGLGYIKPTQVIRDVPVAQPVPSAVVTVPQQTVAPVATQAAVTSQNATVAPVDTTTTWPTDPVYNATCNATLDNYPCDWSSQHFGITLNGPQDNQWVDFFLKLEAGLADGTVVLDPVTFEFKDQNGNVIW